MFKRTEHDVWHHDSPGMRVRVQRNWWQRLIYPKDFSAVGEKVTRLPVFRTGT